MQAADAVRTADDAGRCDIRHRMRLPKVLIDRDRVVLVGSSGRTVAPLPALAGLPGAVRCPAADQAEG